MEDIITALQNTPVPTILVVGGLVFLFLAVVGQFVGEITVPKERQIWAGLVGFLLLFSGVALYVVPPSPSVPTPTVVAAVVPGTSTPSPTNTPRSIPTPTTTIDTDPTMYDDFNNPTDDGGFNQNQWRLSGTSPNPQVQQQDGILIITDDGDQQDTATVLVARKYDDFSLDAPTLFEAELMLSPESGAGNVDIGLFATIDTGDWSSLCSILHNDDQTQMNCRDSLWPQQTDHSHETPGQLVELGTWHTVRIEVDPNSMTITYYIDGLVVDSYVPFDAEKLRGAKFQFVVGTWKTTAEGTMTGFIDNVRIGQLDN